MTGMERLDGTGLPAGILDVKEFSCDNRELTGTAILDGSPPPDAIGLPDGKLSIELS